MPATRETADVGERSDAERAQALLTRHERRVHRLVGHVLGPDPDHEDVVQDVFVRVLTSWRSLRHGEREDAWVTSVTLNQVRNHLRRRKVRRILVSEPEPPELPTSGEDQVAERDLVLRSYRLLDRLRPSDRIVLVLRRAEERSIAEVAELCGCSPATVKRRVARAERRLERALRGDRDLHEHLRERGWL